VFGDVSKLKNHRRRVKSNKNDHGEADTTKGSFGSVMRQDLQYLRLIVNEAVRLHPRRPPEEHVMLANLREYLMWLTIDALEDEVMAKELIHSFATLEDELNVIKVDRRNRRLDPSAPAFYEAFIQALRLVLSYYHRVSLDLEEFYNREKFLKAWTWTQKILDFDCVDACTKVERAFRRVE
jgi:hypothetical protein